MPYGPNTNPQKDKPLTEVERERRIKQLQVEQAQTLRDKLGGPLYDWLDSFDNQDIDFLVEEQ